MPEIEEETDLADRVREDFGCGEIFDAGAEAAVDVELKARSGVVAGEVDFAGGDEEVAVDEVDEAVGEVAGEVGSEVGGTILFEAAGDVDAGEAFGGEFDVGIGFVVAEENVVTGLVLLDQVVFKREGLFVVVAEDVVEVAGLRDEGAGLGFGEAVFVEVGADAGAKRTRFSYVDNLAGCVFI